MSRLKTLDSNSSTGQAKELLDAVKAKLGLVPNMTKAMANSPAVLEGYLGLSGALGGGSLDAKLREQLALLTAQSNHCDYCLSAHSAIGKMVGLNDRQIVDARQSAGSTPRDTAALKFASQVLEGKGHVTAQDFQAVRDAGFADGEIAEIIAHVALNVFTNYFNIATEVDIDFAKVSYAQAS